MNKNFVLFVAVPPLIALFKLNLGFLWWFKVSKLKYLFDDYFQLKSKKF